MIFIATKPPKDDSGTSTNYQTHYTSRFETSTNKSIDSQQNKSYIKYHTKRF